MRKQSVVDNPPFSLRAAWASSGWTLGELAVVAGLILFFLAMLGGMVDVTIEFDFQTGASTAL